jgi:hypothetical protein
MRSAVCGIGGLLERLKQCKQSTPFPADSDWIFASPQKIGRLPYSYQFVIVDASSRLDQTTRLLSDLSNAVLVVAQTDVVSLWSAGRIDAFLQEGTGRDRVRMVLNRYKKIPGFTDVDVQQVTNCKVLWKVPNAFNDLSPSIDNGNPVVRSGGPEIARSYRGLAALLGEEVIDDYWPRGGGPGGGNAPKGGNPPGKPLQKARKPKLDDGFAAAGLELFKSFNAPPRPAPKVSASP